MTDQQELSCPKCGARIYVTDLQCLSCGVRLDEGPPVDERGREAVPAPRRAETQDEQRARPSVWPVYVAAAVVAVVSLGVLAMALFVGGSSFPPPRLAALGYGLVGVIAAVGLVRLRPWGWWCAVVFMSIFAVLFGVSVVSLFIRTVGDPDVAAFAVIIIAPVGLATIALVATVVRYLATRRRLFFPPKTEGKE